MPAIKRLAGMARSYKFQLLFLGLLVTEQLFKIPDYLLKLKITTPALISNIPNHSRMLGRSFRKMTAKMATSTRLNLSTGATLEASPNCSARK